MQDLLGEEFPAFLAVYQQPPVIGLRLNTLKLSPRTWQPLSPYPLSPVPWCPAGFILGQSLPDPASPPFSPGKHPFHAAGLYYLQDPSAMAAAELLAPRPGERVLDLAAAPGGKTTHLAALMEGQGLLVANEIHPQRAWDLAENLERFGAHNAVILNETPARLAAQFGSFFDRVLLDAPCSGEGMFRKSPIARQEWKPGLVQSCALRQGDILTSAAQLVRPGGWLAYTTCTFAPQENEAVIDRFLNAHPDFQLSALPFRAGFEPARPEWVTPPSTHSLERAMRLWPHRLAGEGHFIGILHKDDGLSTKEAMLKPNTLRRPDTAARQDFNAFWQQTMTTPAPEQLHQSGSYIYQLTPGLPDLGDLKQLHPGWWLGSAKTGRFEPSHALALGIQASHAQRALDLDPSDPLLSAYLRGSSLPIPGEAGWILVTVVGYPLGWGKRSAGVIKNLYPRGLRWQG
jgi:NOL1/NOP2/sun family putative RNA methylase